MTPRALRAISHAPRLSFTPEIAEPAIPPVNMMVDSSAVTCRPNPQADVVQNAQARQTEDELDAHIRSCGELAVTEEAHGNLEGAAWWTARMYEAIRSRTPEHQARLTADLEWRIDEATFDGRWALEMANKGLAG
jgi:hypothetical protein